MTEHEAFVALYGILERDYVPHCPNTPDENCLMTGVWYAATGKRDHSHPEMAAVESLAVRMFRRLAEVTGHPLSHLYQWSDAGPKEKVLAGVAECIRQTAPPPPDLFFTDILEETEALS